MSEKYCSCGCGNLMPDANISRKYLPGHRKTNPKKQITYNDIINPNIGPIIKERFEERLINLDGYPIVKNLNECCMTIRPRRGKERFYRNVYLTVCFSINGIDYFETAHRLVYLLYTGPIPSGKPPDGSKRYEVCHLCDVKSCCNPRHITLLTTKQHKKHYIERRSNKHPNSNLTRREIHSIFHYAQKGEHTLQEIADNIKCSIATVKYYLYKPYPFKTDGKQTTRYPNIPISIPKAEKTIRFRERIEAAKECVAEKIIVLESDHVDIPFNEILEEFVYNKVFPSVYVGMCFIKIVLNNVDEYYWGLGYRKINKLLKQRVDLSKPPMKRGTLNET